MILSRKRGVRREAAENMSSLLAEKLDSALAALPGLDQLELRVRPARGGGALRGNARAITARGNAFHVTAVGWTERELVDRLAARLRTKLARERDRQRDRNRRLRRVAVRGAA